MTEWDRVSLEDVAANKRAAFAMGPFGSSITSDNFVESGIPVIRGGNLSSNRLEESGYVYLTPDKADELINSQAVPGDIVITHRGTLGQVVMIPRSPNFPRYIVSQSQMKVTLDENRANPEFVTYFFQSALGQHELLKYASQVGVPSIAQPLSSLRKMQIPLPPMIEQRAIAGVLGALDDKIESNRRAAATAESILVQIANAAMNLPHVELRELVLAHRDQIDPSKIEADSVDHFSIPAFDTDRLPETCSPSSIKSGKLEIKDPSILFSRLNPGTPRLWFSVPGERSALASTEFLIMTDRNGAAPGRDWIAVQSSSFLSEAERRATGTSFSHQRVKPHDALEILVPDTRLLSDEVAAEADDLLNVAHQCRIESRSLAKLRDTLLPELLSGRIRVRDAESIVEEVL
jgi:type I restriction enzyme S subunit